MAGPHIDIFAASCGVRRRGFQQGSDSYYLVWDDVGRIFSRLSWIQLGHSDVDNAKDSVLVFWPNSKRASMPDSTTG
jgi:hypothetical protein